MQQKFFITALLALLITAFSSICFAEEDAAQRDMSVKTVAVLPVISQSQIAYPALEESLKQKLDARVAELIKTKPQEFTYIPPETIREGMSSEMKLGKEFQMTDIRGLAEKIQADIVVAFVVEAANSSTYFNFNKRYLESSAQVRLICFNARTQFFIDTNNLQRYNNVDSPVGSVPKLGELAADNLLKKANMKYEFGLI